jgi:hypothetical protein
MGWTQGVPDGKAKTVGIGPHQPAEAAVQHRDSYFFEWQQNGSLNGPSLYPLARY